MSKTQFTVGQSLWFVPNQKYLGEPREAIITKVGRKWLTLNNGHRCAVDGMCLDGGEYMSPGKCYLTRIEWEIENELSDAWKRFRLDVSMMYVGPKTTVQNIIDARKLLGM